MIPPKSHLIFFFAIPVIMIVGYLGNHRSIDFNIYDTYYVIGNLHFAILISIIFFSLGIGYWSITKWGLKLSRKLTWIHLGSTFGGGILALILSQFYSEDPLSYHFNDKLTAMICLIIVIIAIGHFAINLIVGLLNKPKQPSG